MGKSQKGARSEDLLPLQLCEYTYLSAPLFAVIASYINNIISVVFYKLSLANLQHAVRLLTGF